MQFHSYNRNVALSLRGDLTFRVGLFRVSLPCDVITFRLVALEPTTEQGGIEVIVIRDI